MPPEERSQPLTKALARDAVEKEVGRVIDEEDLVGDGLGNRVPVSRRVVPVGFADEEDHTRSDADKETEGSAEAQRRHLFERKQNR